MKQKITVMVAGRPYQLVCDEEIAYVEKVAGQVDGMVTSVMKQAKVPVLDAAILTAINAADSALKAQEMVESLRIQLQEEVEATRRAKLDLAEARREIKRIRTKAEKASKA